MLFDRAAILRSAHARARQCVVGHSNRSYRQAFARALSLEWHHAKMAKAQAEIEAEDAIELPEDVRAECAELRLRASCLPFACTSAYRELNDEANAIEKAALAAAMLSQRGGSYLVAR